MGGPDHLWTLQIKHGLQQLDVSMPATAKILELQERLQDITGTFARKQKLIHKGKVLAFNQDLVTAGLSNGAKLIMLLSDGKGVTTQGQQALQQQKKARQEETAHRVRELYAEAKGISGSAASAIPSAVATATAGARAGPKLDWQERKRNWEKAGIISLRDLGLAALPNGLFDSGLETARVADLSHNRLEGVPVALSRLTDLNTLRLDHNQLRSDGLLWEAVAQLTGLRVLSLEHNKLDVIPDAAITGLSVLEICNLSHNALSAVPKAVGQLGELRVLLADGNRLEALPESIGGCSSLLELSAEGNRIRHLPPSLAQLTRLQTIRLDGNIISAVPPSVLRDCASLATISLQGNPITADQLRSTPGFAEYDARRVARCNKQLGAGILEHASRVFTEGAVRPFTGAHRPITPSQASAVHPVTHEITTSQHEGGPVDSQGVITGRTSSPTRRDVLRLASTTALTFSVTPLQRIPGSSSAHAATLEALPTPAVNSVRAASTVERIDLAPGLNISRVVKGCWQLSGGHRGERETDRTGGQAAVEDLGKFTAAGITTFDAADHYGPAEVLIGRYLSANPDRRPPNTQVLTKYCVFSRRDMAEINKEAVKQALNLSRSRLGVESVDLMQYYWGDYAVNRYVDGALYLSELASEGLIRHVGVTNFDVPRMESMTAAGVRIASNQLQYSLLDRRPENGMAQFCAAHGIAMLPYGVLAGGFLSTKYLGVPASKVKVDTYSKGKYAGVINAAGGWAWFQSLLQVLDSVARKYDISISNVAARWVLQRPGVAAVILGARNADHVNDQVRLFSFRLDEQDLAAIQEVLDRGRLPKSDCYTWERGGEW